MNDRDPAEIAAHAVAQAMAEVLRQFITGEGPSSDAWQEKLKAAAQQHAGPLPQNRRQFGKRLPSAIRLGGSESPHG